MSIIQLRSLLISTPRYLAWSMASSTCPCNMYMCWAGCLDLEMCNTWHLLGLKSMSHRRSHVCKVSRSCWRVSESEWLLIVIQIAASSAKSRTCECMFSSRSLIYSKNRSHSQKMMTVSGAFWGFLLMKKLVPLPYKYFYGLCNPRKTFS